MTIGTEITNFINMEREQLLTSAVLIGSANIPFRSVQELSKYPFNYNPIEGFIGMRSSPGCKTVDAFELYGTQLAQKVFLFNETEYSISFNPLSGTVANQIVYNAILEPKDVVLSMDLSSGGHISHYHYLHKFFCVKTYEANTAGVLDYDKIESMCKKYSPKLLIAGASAFPREIRYDILGRICKKYKILLLADISHTALFIITGNHISPFGYADFISVTTHKTTRGPRSGLLFYKHYYKECIEFSIFPLTQSAPRYSDIIGKVVMLDELQKMDIFEYERDILWYSQHFCKVMKMGGLDVYTDGTDTHLSIIKSYYPVSVMQKRLQQHGILTDTCYLPGEITPQGLRFGFLIIAFLKINENDFNTICDLILNILTGKYMINNYKTVNQIIKKYAIKLQLYFN